MTLQGSESLRWARQLWVQFPLGKFIFCWNFLRHLNANFVQNVWNVRFVLFTKTWTINIADAENIFFSIIMEKEFFFTTQHQRGNKSRKTKGGSITLICSQYLCYHVSHSQTPRCLFSFARIASRQWNVRCADCLKCQEKANRFTVLPCAVIDRFKPTAFVVKSFTVWSGTSAVEWTEKWCSAWELF